jgi:hypothetical protein
MGHARGGWSKVDFDDNAGFTTPIEISGLLKESTNFEPTTPTEELADGTDAGAGKKLAGAVRTKDINQTALTELRAAEAALTQLWFRFYHMNGTDFYTLKKCRIVVAHEPKPTGAFHAVKIGISGYATTESDVIALTMA